MSLLLAASIHRKLPPYRSQVLVQPFVSRRAPANWDRVVTFVQFLSMELLYLAGGVFADDVYCDEGAFIFNSAVLGFRSDMPRPGVPHVR